MNLRAICCRVSLAALAGSMLAYGDQINQAEVFVNPNSAGGTGPFSQVVSQPGVIDIGGSATGPSTGGPVESGDGSAHVEYGKIKLFNSVFASATGESFGRFRDDVLLDDPAVAIGTPMTVTYSLFVDGLLSVNSTGYGAASWLMQSALGSNLFSISKSGTERSPELSNPGYTGDPLGQLYTAQATMQNGIAAQLDVELTVDSSAGFDPSLNPGAATENFLNTLAWGGIQEVTLGGQQVAYTLSSSSGTDWTQDFAASETGVPEPATPIAAVAVIGVCLGFLRKRSGLTSPVSRPSRG